MILVKNTQSGDKFIVAQRAFVFDGSIRFFHRSLQGGFPAAVFVFLARTAGARIVVSDFSLCLAICRSLCAESRCHPLALWRKVAVNRCHGSGDAEDQFFSEFACPALAGVVPFGPRQSACRGGTMGESIHHITLQ